MSQVKQIDIDAVPAGPQLDALVAEHVMNRPFTHKQSNDTVCGYGGHCDGCKFSANLIDAAKVEAEIEQRGLEWSYEACLLHEVWKPDGLHVKRPKGNFKLITATPEQRCRAALKAVMDG